jgi:hypothetical protein
MRERIKQKKAGSYEKKRLKAVELIIDSKGKNVGEQLKRAGYSDNYAHNPQNFLATDAVKKEIDFIKYEKAKIIERMDKTRKKAKYKELSDSYLGFSKLNQLLGGGATERIVITPTEKEEVDKAFNNL